jgi:ABC-2 type transport system permease protein
MFSKALFKQSCKAHGTMWGIITFAVCFMLACVMLISGSGNIGETKNAIQDTIIVKEVDSSLEKRAVNYYSNASDGLNQFDKLFVKNISENKNGLLNPTTQEQTITTAYTSSIEELQQYVYDKAIKIDASYTEDSDEAQEMLGAVMYVLNPNGKFNDFYTSNGEDIPSEYDVTSLIGHIVAGDIENYLVSDERQNYIYERAKDGAAVFIAGNMTTQENIDKMVESLSEYGVTKEKYDSFGYTYDSVKHMAGTTIATYKSRYDYELDEIESKNEKGEYATEEEYINAKNSINVDVLSDMVSSLLASLPEEVSSALEEIGTMDLYSLIVGSIFYKLAGLLLPIIYVIMASNNLISGQVDTGSMAYILSTSTKRKTVVFTQAVYLLGSLFAMFTLTTITGSVCLNFVSEDVELTHGKLVLLNVGAFLVLVALSGLCFLTSCLFDRSKRSMAIGGGLSIFALVAAMLGLFGSPVIPSVVRLKSLNFFNYATIISLFDVVSIIDGTNAFVWKFVILGVVGIIGYIIGSVKFIKKDLPL